MLRLDTEATRGGAYVAVTQRSLLSYVPFIYNYPTDYVRCCMFAVETPSVLASHWIGRERKWVAHTDKRVALLKVNFLLSETLQDLNTTIRLLHVPAIICGIRWAYTGG
jgi:hypothetical protein